MDWWKDKKKKNMFHEQWSTVSHKEMLYCCKDVCRPTEEEGERHTVPVSVNAWDDPHRLK